MRYHDRWEAERVQQHVIRFIGAHNITDLVTFDGYGISGHKNHIDVYAAIR